MALQVDDIIRLLLAVLVGGLIGAEREYRDKVAGFRTIIFICLGATLFTMLSLKLGVAGDPLRIAANVVSGVGFLGAGAILHDARRVIGLTTAATIWLAAALGMGIGSGHYILVLSATGVVLVVLIVFPRIEGLIDSARETHTYEVTGPARPELYAELEETIAGCGLRIAERQRVKAGPEMVCTWQVRGTAAAHERLAAKLLAHAEVTGFRA